MTLCFKGYQKYDGSKLKSLTFYPVFVQNIIENNCLTFFSGALGLIDRRSSNMKAVSKMKICDTVSPKMVSVHPTKTNVVFLAPVDQGCGIFDLRKQVRRYKGDQAISSIKPLVRLTTNLADLGEFG